MGVSDPKKSKKTTYYHIRLALNIFLFSFSLSILMSFTSQIVLTKSSLFFAFFALFVIIFIGVVFDVIGVAFATADAVPFHAMASKKNPRAKVALKLLKRASLVATFSNDVVGDIAGIISGAAVASIVFRLSSVTAFGISEWLNVLLSGLAAGITVGGKAIGKELAIKKSKHIVYFVSALLYDIKLILSFSWLKKRKGK